MFASHEIELFHLNEKENRSSTSIFDIDLLQNINLCARSFLSEFFYQSNVIKSKLIRRVDVDLYVKASQLRSITND